MTLKTKPATLVAATLALATLILPVATALTPPAPLLLHMVFRTVQVE